jgi:hypothetical protein
LAGHELPGVRGSGAGLAGEGSGGHVSDGME